MKTDWQCDSHDNRKKLFILTLTTHEKNGTIYAYKIVKKLHSQVE